MEELDLKIENYNLKDLLNLFHLKHKLDKKRFEKGERNGIENTSR